VLPAIGFSEDGMRTCQALCFKIGETGKAVKDGLDTLHHERAPDVLINENEPA
jgi:hypothetical protein